MIPIACWRNTWAARTSARTAAGCSIPAPRSFSWSRTVKIARWCYSVVPSRSMAFEEGKVYTFRCPICRSDLTSSLDENLVDILTQNDEEMMVRVSFSRIFGEQATFLRAPDGVDRYGEHASRYENVNFFGETADQNGD